MTLRVHVGSEGERAPASRAAIERVALATLRAEKVRAAMLSVTLVTARAIARLNHRHFGQRGSTDVIAFGFAPPGRGASTVIGDIYISPSVARANARRYGVRVRDELLRLVVHGTLHVLGYDHPEGEERVRSRMWRRQEILLARALRARGA
ncbi:MAG: rRNA maturation RNase YbeY [Gemmatimonadota bacterium]|nr:rRNA maturation RNase YbeY [Gemmatimonadota bacterium]